MIEAQARVVAVEDGYAWVESERRSACSHCDGSESCGVSSLGKLFGVRKQRMRLEDPLGVRAGEAVVIGLSEQHLLVAAALAYLLPLLAMIVATLLAEYLGYDQGALALFSLAGLGAGLWLVKGRSGRRNSYAHYRPVILGRQQAGEYPIEFKSSNTGVSHE